MAMDLMMLFPFFDAAQIVPVSDNQKPLPHVPPSLAAHSATTANDSRHPRPPQRIQPFHAACPANQAVAAFVGRAVLPRCEKRFVGLPPVRVDQLAAVGRRNLAPQESQHRKAARPQRGSDDLPGLTRTDNPEPQRRRLADTQFINFKRVTFRSGNYFYGLFYGPFFRMARMVCRPTLSRRAIPRCEMRSARAASMSCCLWGVMPRSIGCGDHVFLQSRQRRR